MFRLLGRLIERALRSYADGGPQLAAAIAFRVLFSVFPLVIVLTAAFGLVVSAAGLEADVIDTIVDSVPLDEAGQDSLRSLLEGVASPKSGFGLLAGLVLVWSASGMMGAIRYALNRAWPSERGRPYLQGKLLDVLLVVGVSFLLVLSIGLSIAARVLSENASEALARAGLGAGAITWAIALIVPGLLAFVAVAFLYRVVPAARPGLRAVLPFALLVAVALVALQTLFAVYLAHFGRYNAIYGSLGAVVALLFYVYLSASALLLGAEAAAAYPRVRAELEQGGADGDGQPLRTRLGRFLRSLAVHERE